MRSTILRMLAGGLLASAVSACSSAYLPYAVERTPAPTAQFDTLPIVDSTPVGAGADYRLYKAAASSDLYVVPMSLELEASRTKADAINFQRHDGKHEILVLWARPRDLDIQAVADAFPGRRVRYYPIDRLTTRTLTQAHDQNVFRVTATREPAAISPFALMIAIQAFGRENIRDFKALLRLPSGFLLEARFVMQTADRGQVEVAIPINLGSMSLTEQTL